MIALIAIIVSETASAATYYVATNGNDSVGTRSVGSSWATIDHAGSTGVLLQVNSARAPVRYLPELRVGLSQGLPVHNDTEPGAVVYVSRKILH